MKTCTIKFSNGKWVGRDGNGNIFCSFDAEHKSWAYESARANGYVVI